MNHRNESNTLQEWRESAPYWEKHRDVIRAMFGPLTQALIEEVGIGARRSMLDPVTGAGEPSLTITRVVGPTGRDICPDAVAEMVEAAEREAQQLGIMYMRFDQCMADS